MSGGWGLTIYGIEKAGRENFIPNEEYKKIRTGNVGELDSIEEKDFVFHVDELAYDLWMGQERMGRWKKQEIR